jgi:hypothetical protein
VRGLIGDQSGFYRRGGYIVIRHICHNACLEGCLFNWEWKGKRKGRKRIERWRDGRKESERERGRE